jgi:hypothetical protein
MAHGNHHATVRSGEGRGGPCGGRATRCGRQFPSRAVHVQATCDRCQNRGGGGLPGFQIASYFERAVGFDFKEKEIKFDLIQTISNCFKL